MKFKQILPMLLNDYIGIATEVVVEPTIEDVVFVIDSGRNQNSGRGTVLSAPNIFQQVGLDRNVDSEGLLNKLDTRLDEIEYYTAGV